MLLELLAIFVLLPWLIWRGWLPVDQILLPLYLAGLYAVIRLRGRDGLSLRRLCSSDEPARERAALRRLGWRFAVLAPAIVLFTASLYPERLFDLPTQHTGLWLLLMFLYPLLSVCPQELLYRPFFFHRYAALFPSTAWLLRVDALLFGYMHIVFGNGLAIALTTLGGYLFADTYARSRSLRLVCLEHTLYGNLLFSVGLGEFFLYGHGATAIEP